MKNMLKTFRLGGVHPPQEKLSAGRKIIQATIPKEVVVLTGQHIGKPAIPVVERGASVKVGTLLARPDGFVSAAVHSPVSGTVKKIDNTLQTNGKPAIAIFIDVQGDDWEQNIDTSDTLVTDITLNAQEIVERVTNAGIVGLGGATFPTHVKLKVPDGQKADVLIINAVECEPYLTADHALMIQKSYEIMIGIRILMAAVGVDRAIVGIENNKSDATLLLSKIAQSTYKNIEVVPLTVKYPQGSEKHLIEALTGRKVKAGQLPISVGAVVQNVGTVFAVYEAVQKNKPLVERVVTVTGDDVKQPANFLVRIGTPIRQLIDEVGGLPDFTGKVIAGGPMMGKTVVQLDAPVIKGTSGILLLPRSQALPRTPTNCIRCAKCLNACPMQLNPTLLMNATEAEQWDLAENNYITDCIECGSCVFSCPANRPILDLVRLGKSNVMTIIRNRK